MTHTSNFMEWQRNWAPASGLSWRRSMSVGALLALQFIAGPLSGGGKQIGQKRTT
jgi:hypothetical protein